MALCSIYATPRVYHSEVLLEIRPGTRHVDSLQAVESYGALRRVAKLVVVGFCWLRIYKCSLELLQSRSCRLWCECLAASTTSDQLSFLFCCSLSIRLLLDLENILILVVCCYYRCCTRKFFLFAYIDDCIFCGVFKSQTLRRRRTTSRTYGQRRSDLWQKWDGFGLLFSAATH